MLKIGNQNLKDVGKKLLIGFRFLILFHSEILAYANYDPRVTISQLHYSNYLGVHSAVCLLQRLPDTDKKEGVTRQMSTS